ncbi:MAG TPA: hypothetical protein VK028_09390 [Micromonosporaceae bacterium]|nr:hypothetical protein [Micromonosporaceae bacterium]
MDALLIAVLASAAVVISMLRRRAVQSRWRHLLASAVRSAERTRGRSSGAIASGAIASGPVRRLLRSPRARLVLGTVSGGIAGAVAGGPVAGSLAAVYAAVATVIVRWWRQQRAEATSRRCAVDAVAGLAAELRAGASVTTALGAAECAFHAPRVVGAEASLIGRRVACAVEVAETSGAPLADVLDRLDSHLRAMDRARAAAEAQAAGARASALMLAAMPAAGVGLGYAIGTDPFDVLLHTPLGAACLAGAVVLQISGLAWSVRLSRIEAST